MKIVQQSPSYLELQGRDLRSLKLASLLGIPSLAIGLALLVSFSQPTRLTCDRTKSDPSQSVQVTCQLKSPKFLGVTVTTIPANQLKGATVVTQDGEQRIVLQTTNGNIPLVNHANQIQDPRDADRINNFIGNLEETSLEVQYGNRGLLFGIGCILSVAGLFFAVGWLPWTRIFVSCQFDKDKNQMRLIERTLLRTKTTKQQLSDIHQINVNTGEDVDGYTTYCINLVLQSGETICLPLIVSPQQDDRKTYDDFAKRIRSFLKIER